MDGDKRMKLPLQRTDDKSLSNEGLLARYEASVKVYSIVAFAYAVVIYARNCVRDFLVSCKDVRLVRLVDNLAA